MGCAIPLVCLLIIFGAVGILTGNWAALYEEVVRDARGMEPSHVS